MLILSYGMTKSGSTLVFELCKAVLEQAGYKQRRLPDDVVAEGHHINFLDHISVETLTKALAAVTPEEKIVVKLHAPIAEQEIAFIANKIQENAVAVHVNCRDPREICLSLVDAGDHARRNGKKAFAEIHSLDDAAKVVTRQLRVCRNWGSIAGVKFYFYNEVAFSTHDVVDRMCAEFGIRQFEDQAYEAVVGRAFNDAFTQKNKATKDRYKDELTVRQNERLLSEIKGGARFVNEVCRKRDFSWFAGAKNPSRGATSGRA